MKQPTRSDDLRSTRRRAKKSRLTRSGRRSAFEPLESRLVLTVSLQSGAVPDEVVLFPDTQSGVYQIASGPIDASGIEMIDLSIVTDDDQRHRVPPPESLNDVATLVRVDPNETYTITARSFNPAIEPNISTPITNSLKIKTYDADHNLIEPIHVSRHDYAVDTTLAATLSPGDDAFYIVDASGWSNTLFESAITRAIAWYGYIDSTGHTHDDYTYTRNVAVDLEEGLWEPGGISYDSDVGAYQIDLLKPWEGPTLAAGSAIRNAVAAQNPLSLEVAETKGEEHLWADHTGTFGGDLWQDGVPDGQTLPPGTAYLAADFLDARLPFANVVVGPTQDFAFAAPSDPLRPTVSIGGDQRLRLEFDVLSKGALPSFMPGMAGNFDNDDNLDGSDYLAWQRGLGSNYDAADLDDWQENYGSIGDVVLAAVEAPDHGNAQIITNTNGQLAIDYQSAPWFVGTDLVQYTLRNTTSGQTFDGTIAVEVLGGNVGQDPSVVATLESQAQVSDGNEVPQRISFHQQFFSYAASSGQTLLADGVRNPGLLTMFTDPTDELVVRLLDGPSHGSLKLNFDGTFEYKAEAGFVGGDTIKFEVFDGLHTTTDIATISVFATSDDLLDHRMKAIANAMSYFEAVNYRFPVTEGFDVAGNPYLSWRVHLLPYLGFQELYNQFNLEEPWNSATNLPLQSQMPDVFRSPEDSPTSQTTRFQTFTGPDAPFGRFTDGSDQVGPRLADFTDDTNHTILFAHSGADEAAAWTQPDDLEFDATDPLAALGTITADKITIVTADSELHEISASIDPEDFKALVTSQGEEVVDAGTLARQYREASGQPAPTQAEFDADGETRMRKIIRALLNYEDARKKFPPAGGSSQAELNRFDPETGKSNLSWRVLILPSLGYQNLYDQFNLNEPWDSPNNLALVSEMPDIFRDLDDLAHSETTRIATWTTERDELGRAPLGVGFMIPAIVRDTLTRTESGVSSASFRDGFAQTVLVVEAGADKATIWTKPDDLIFNAQDPLETIGNLTDETVRVAFGDRTTLKIPADFSATDFMAIATRASGEVLDTATLRNQQLQAEGIQKSPLQRSNDFRNIALGILNYESVFGELPIQGSRNFDDDGFPYLSWRVHILPFLEQQNLYDQFNLDEPWDSPNNLPLLEYMPDFYRSSGDPFDSTTTRMMNFTGPGAPFLSRPAGDQEGPQLRQITDGTSSTISFVEAGSDQTVPWTKPTDLDFHANNPYSALGQLDAKFLAAFMSGRVEGLSSTLSVAELAARITHNGGESLDDVQPFEPTAQFYVNQTAGDTTTNEFGVDVFDVVLDKQPASDVVFDLIISNLGIATLDTQQLVFTPENWNVAQRIAVRGVDNFVVNADRTVEISIAVNAGLSDAEFAILDTQTIAATIVDDDLVPIVADFNQDRRVDAADLAAWSEGYTFSTVNFRNGSESFIIRPSNGDIDRDQDVDGTDFLTLQRNLGTQPSPGDLSGDDHVDLVDLEFWQVAYSDDARGDIDLDGDSDGTDFLAWQRNHSAPTPTVAVLASDVPPIDAVLGLDEEEEPDEDEFFANQVLAEAVGSSAEPDSALAAAAAQWSRSEAANAERDSSNATSGPWLDDELIERVFG